MRVTLESSDNPCSHRCSLTSGTKQWKNHHLNEGSSHSGILTGIIMHGEMNKNKILECPKLLEFPSDEQFEHKVTA